jgi:Ca2+:H+ antiporter
VSKVIKHKWLHWTRVLPILAFAALIVSWIYHPTAALVLAVLTILLIGSIIASVHHAEVIAQKVGEPFGSLVLAVAVTVIEVGLILTLMASGKGSATLARDTVFAAVMITINGIMGLSLTVSAARHSTSRFSALGSGGALATVTALAGICLVLPRFTVSDPSPSYTPSQLAFAGVASLVLYGLFIAAQTGRHRSSFLPIDEDGMPIDTDDDSWTPTTAATLRSLGFLLIALVAVVGLAKILSPTIEAGVAAAGLPPGFVGVIIALVVLAPESLAAVRAARQNRVQVSLNLALGSAMASIGLTIPTLAVAMIWFPGEFYLGLGSTQIVLLVMSVLLAMLTIAPGRATRLQGGVHLVILAAYIFLAANP